METGWLGLLVHDHVRGDQPLLCGVNRKSKAFQRVGAKEGGAVVLPEYDERDHALSVYRGPRLPKVHINPPPVSQQKPTPAGRGNS